MKPERIKKPKSSNINPGASEEEIRLRAYYLYLERDGEPGHELEDWLRAEQELTKKPRGKRKK